MSGNGEEVPGQGGYSIDALSASLQLSCTSLSANQEPSKNTVCLGRSCSPEGVLAFRRLRVTTYGNINGCGCNVVVLGAFNMRCSASPSGYVLFMTYVHSRCT